jgi:hypothetical protein
MNLFSGDKLSGEESSEDRICPRCHAQPRLVHRMLDSLTGKTVRSFECACGEKTWIDNLA